MIKKVHKSNQICYTGPRIEELVNDYPEEVYSDRLQKILDEFVEGFHFLKKYGLAATFFGSARCTFRSKIYKDATKLAKKLAEDDFTIITGGGPGIMEAANKGAVEADGKSVGLNIELPKEQSVNPYVKEYASFYYFFTRKVMLAFASEVYIFYPGGFGTLDEFFEMLTLVQTEKIEPIPIVLVGEDYWNPLTDWIEEMLFEKNQAISKVDMKLYHVVADANEAYELIKKMVKRAERVTPITNLR